MTLPAFPRQTQPFVMTYPKFVRTTPQEDPQSLVFAVELAKILDKLRRQWPSSHLRYPQQGTWPIISWQTTLHEAIYDLLTQALIENIHQNIDIQVHIDKHDTCLRLDIRGQTKSPHQWLPTALSNAYRLAVWQGGRLFWHAFQNHWQICLKLPFCPLYPK